ncbi:DUF7666 domain-containing protein [[Eubacterium] hominis]|uniref:DUF7666 domain-containing protein n=1 Tax=[Eubacterium] hominis TaxID=2764325 RepID=UPI0023DD7E3E
MSNEVKGYKVFNPNWTCRGFQYEVGKTFEENVIPECCEVGFHFCIKASDCFNYYSFDPENKVAEVTALGDVDCEHEDSKCATNKIRIDRELSWQEVLEIVNTGKGCTGLCNSGNRNSGDCNSGDCNSGDCNSGDCNSGDCNSGDCNSGDCNSGDCNSGDCNSGDCNSGDCNSGDCNSGDCNSGDCNSGDCNSGDCNSGDCNSGDCNSGDCNSGDCNSGDCNSGDWNSGNRNSGDWNSGNRNSGDWNKASFCLGCFNTVNQKLKFFDKETDITFNQWRNSDAYYLLSRIDDSPVDWIWEDDMTDEEKESNPDYEINGGYLKVRNTSNAIKEWWKSLDLHERNIIKNIPNFDEDKFKLITGIDVNEDE